MAVPTKDASVFEDTGNSLTQFILPSIEGGNIPSNETSLHEESLVELPVIGENMQFFQILGEHGGVQFVQLIQNNPDHMTVNSSSSSLISGNGLPGDEIQLVQTADGALTYLTQGELANGMNTTNIQIQQNTTVALPTEDVEGFVQSIERPVQDQADIIEETVLDLHGIHPVTSTISQMHNNLASEASTTQSSAIYNQESNLLYNHNDNSVIRGSGSDSQGEYIYISNDVGSTENNIPLPFNMTQNGPVMSRTGDVPVKVIEIPSSLAAPERSGNVIIETLKASTSANVSSVPVKMVPVPSSIPTRGVLENMSTLANVSTPYSLPFSGSNSIIKPVSGSMDAKAIHIISNSQIGPVVSSCDNSVVSPMLKTEGNEGRFSIGHVSVAGTRPEGNVVVIHAVKGKDVKLDENKSQNGGEVSQEMKQNGDRGDDKVEQKKGTLDLNKPIELTSQTVVTVNGKKCQLRVDPSSKQLVAYPVKPDVPKRPRGRPRKPKLDECTIEAADEVEEEEGDEQTDPVENTTVQTEKESHALAGLLGLSDIDGRRKSLRSKKKPKTLVDEYETGTIDGVDEESSEPGFVDNPKDRDISVPLHCLKTGTEGQSELNDQGPVVIRGLTPVVKRGRGRPRTKPITTTDTQTKSQLRNYLANLGLPVKRGRGRPRRSLPDGVTGPVCAYVIPSSGKQTIVMATAQGKNDEVTSSMAPNGLPTVRPEVKSSESMSPTPSVITLTSVATSNTTAVTTASVMKTSTCNGRIITTPTVSLKQIRGDQAKAAILPASPPSNKELRVGDTITLTANSQEDSKKISPPELNATEPTVIPIIRSLASGNITMTTASMCSKPDPLKTDLPTTSMHANTKLTLNDGTSVPKTVFTVIPDSGKIPIIIKCIDNKSGQIRLKKLGGADNKLSQDIMTGQRLDVIDKGVIENLSTPQVKTALDGTLTVLYEKKEENSGKKQPCDADESTPSPTQESILKTERIAEQMDEDNTGVAETNNDSETNEQTNSGEDKEEDEVDVESAEDEIVMPPAELVSLAMDDTPLTQNKVEEFKDQRDTEEQQALNEDTGAQSDQTQKSPSIQVQLLESLTDSNLVMLNPSNPQSENPIAFTESTSEETGEKVIEVSEYGETSKSTTTSIKVEEADTYPSAVVQATKVIQLPQELLPLIMSKTSTPTSVPQIGLRSTEEELEQYKCCKCGFQAFYEHQYREHIAAHSDVELHKCKCCMFVSFTNEELINHFKKVHPKLLCTICNFMAEHKYTIKRHMQRHDPEGYACDLCGKKYKDQYILNTHLKMVHMPAEVLFECEVCQKKFTRKAHLKRHMRTHDPEKPFKCPHCDYRGCERSDITKHVVIHDEPKFWCEVCGKNFRHIKNKELHLKRHRGQRDYKCGVCDFYGYTFTDIRKHIERKHAEHRNIMCQNCGCKFRNEAMLKDHSKYCGEMLLVEPGVLVPKSEMNLVEASTQGIEDVDLNDSTSQVLNGQDLHSTAGHYMEEDEGTVMEEQVTLADDVAVSFSDQCIAVSSDHLELGGAERLMDTPTLSEMSTVVECADAAAVVSTFVSSGHFVRATSSSAVSQRAERQTDHGRLQGMSLTGLEVGQCISSHHHHKIVPPTLSESAGYNMDIVEEDVYGETSEQLHGDNTMTM